MALSKPVIAAVEGHAVAGGLELAVWCDLRVAAADAVFGVFCRRFGVPLVDGGTVRLPRLVGEGRALDLILTRSGRRGRGGARHGARQPGRARPGRHSRQPVAWAAELAALPQVCMRNDRRSALAQWGLPVAEALPSRPASAWTAWPRARRSRERPGSPAVPAGAATTVSGTDA